MLLFFILFFIIIPKPIEGFVQAVLSVESSPDSDQRRNDFCMV